MSLSPESIRIKGPPRVGAAIDDEVLGRLQDDLGGSHALLQIVRIFLRELDGRTSMIEDTARRAELAMLARGARHLRPSAEVLGATVLTDVLSALEHAAEAGDVSACQQLALRFATQVSLTRAALERIAARLDAALPVEV
jgi:hypothetical protein